MVDVMKHYYLFPTLVSKFQHISDNILIDAIKNEALVNKQMNFHSKASVDNELHKKSEYQKLVKSILDNTKEICKIYEYEYKELEITNMWINHSQKGDMHSPHSHSNNTFSGVWFPLHSKIQTPLYFHDPKGVSGVWQPRKTKVNNLTSNMMSFKHEKDFGFIFPSWLMHFVPPAVSERVSLSWNIIVRGEYGEPNTLQNAYI